MICWKNSNSRLKSNADGRSIKKGKKIIAIKKEYREEYGTEGKPNCNPERNTQIWRLNVFSVPLLGTEKLVAVLALGIKYKGLHRK